MAKPADDAKPAPPQEDVPAASEPVDLQDEMHRVLFDHEMERGTTTTTKIPQRRRRGRIIRG